MVGTLGLAWVIPPGALPDLVEIVNVLGALVLFVALSLKLVRAG